MRIKKNDTIQVISGKDRGKTAKVLEISYGDNRVLVEGINVYKKHVRPRRQGEKGQTISASRPLSASNVLLYCSACGRGVRTGVKVVGNSKVRACKKCQRTL
jgi:large subunit ribosomal protein L24